MKNRIAKSYIAALLVGASQLCGCGCNAYSQTSQEQQVNQTKTVTIKLKITGMTCGGCANGIHNALSTKEGILGNEVKFEENLAIVQYNPAKITEKEIIGIIEKVGYKAEKLTEKSCEPGCQKPCCTKSN